MDKIEKQNNPQKGYKIDKKKKFVAYLLTGATLLGLGSTLHIRIKNHKINSNSEYAIGYDNISWFNNITNQVTENNFVLLDIGNHQDRGVLYENQKLDYCVKNGIDIGLILTSKASSLADIYLDLEYVMGILEKYPVEYPIYLDIDGILNNEKLTLDHACELIEAFFKKAESNHLYIGIYGTEENQSYITPLIENNRLIKENNSKKSNYGSISKEDGIYYASKDLKEQIKKSSYNDPNFFLEDGYHLLKEGETLQDVSRLYGLSVNDLKEYNNISQIEKEENPVLRIPSTVQENSTYLEQNSVRVGVDVSLWQEEINWEEVTADYAIIQVRDFANQENDPQFENNVKGCLENNIPFGFYIFSRASTQSGVQLEAKYLISQIKDLPVTYPIYLDLETGLWASLKENGVLASGNYTEEESKLFIIDFLQTWEKEITQAGFIPGIYCNYNLYNKLNSITEGYLDNLQCWVAGGEYYNQEINTQEEIPVISLEENEKMQMKQISSMGTTPGISTPVDLNYCYVDYETRYDWERKQFLKKDTIIVSTFPVYAALLGGLALEKTKNQLRKKVKRKSDKSNN